jgi:hypothetical protein
MIDVYEAVALAAGGINSVANFVQGAILHKQTKEIAELKGSATTAASAYNAAEEAKLSAARANQHADWLHGELDKKALLPERPKTHEELSEEFFKNINEVFKNMAKNVKNSSDTNNSGGNNNNNTVLSDEQFTKLLKTVTDSIKK